MERWRVAAVLALALCWPASASAQYAPVDRDGAKLSVTTAHLKRSLRCSGPLKGVRRDPLLLLAGTTMDTATTFGWNYERALRARRIPFCTLDQPGRLAENLGDVQLRGAYVVAALRRMQQRARRRVAVFGHSQGGMVTRWALRFWPDTRRLVSDVIGAAPSNHGTLSAEAICVAGCAAAIWQQRASSQFNRALNSGQETFAGIDYTTITSRLDQIVVPYTSQALRGPGRISNVVVQDICPQNLSEHLTTGTSDPVAFALVMDALDHRGPADAARIDRAVCGQSAHPGVDPGTFLGDLAGLGLRLASNLATYPTVTAEPRLADYTRR